MNRRRATRSATAGSLRTLHRSALASPLTRCVKRIVLDPASLTGAIHRDERGAISVLSVFAVFMFTILLVLIVNVGRQIDDKIRMQNAADAAAYSGATVVSRGMNAIAFSNHLMCETFALTAYMREGRDRKSEKFIPEILDAWQKVGTAYATGTGSEPLSQKFKKMGEAIVKKVPIERQMVNEFSEMAFHESKVTLPLLEYILAGPDFENSNGIPDRSPMGGFLPRFERAVLQTVPYIASLAADEVATRYGSTTKTQHQSQNLRGLIWSTNMTVLGTKDETVVATRTLPVIDPSRSGTDSVQVGESASQNCPSCVACMECISRKQRERWARWYLEQWIRHWMSPYFEYPDNGSFTYGPSSAKMSNYINFWRIYTCANLTQLLEVEYPHTNLPFVLRDPPTRPFNSPPPPDTQLTEPWDFDGCVQTPTHPDRPCGPPTPLTQQAMDSTYTFVAVAYWPHQKPMFPGLFKNPLVRDSQTYAATFAQARIFLPRARFSRVTNNPPENTPWGYLHPCQPTGNVCCADLYDKAPGDWERYVLSNTNPGSVQVTWYLPPFAYDARWEQFGQWDSFNQNWTTQLVPATASNVPSIMAQHPGVYLNGGLQGLQPPRLLNAPLQTFNTVNTH